MVLIDGAIPALEERLLATRESEAKLTAAKTRAEANFKKEARAAEGAKAMQEYQANGREIRDQMARLRALRLAKEAEEKVKAAALVPVEAAPKSGSKTDTKKASKAKKVAVAQ